MGEAAQEEAADNGGWERQQRVGVGRSSKGWGMGEEAAEGEAAEGEGSEATCTTQTAAGAGKAGGRIQAQ